MKAIKFTESELEFLQSHYELELVDAENYVGELKNILKKLGVIEKEITKAKPAKTSGKKAGRPKKEKKEKKAIVEAPVPASAKQVKKAPAKKVSAKKEPAKKVPAAKTPVAKTPAKKAPAKNTPVKKTVKKIAKPAVKTNKPVALPAPAKPETLNS